MIHAERLVAIVFLQRKANSRYASFSQCQMELRAIEAKIRHWRKALET